MIEDGKNGLLFTPADSHDLWRKLSLVVENRTLRDDLVRGIPRVKTIQENAQEIEQIYERLVRESPGRRPELVAS